MQEEGFESERRRHIEALLAELAAHQAGRRVSLDQEGLLEKMAAQVTPRVIRWNRSWASPSS